LVFKITCTFHAELKPALDALVMWADHWKNESDERRTFSVVNKPSAGPSGNIHDFYSLGTYWWLVLISFPWFSDVWNLDVVLHIGPC
jgi:hypothetical protein